MAFFTHITHESWSLPTPLLLCLNITEQKRRSHILDDPDAYFGIAHLSYLDKLAIRIDSHAWLNNNASRLDSLSDPSATSYSVTRYGHSAPAPPTSSLKRRVIFINSNLSPFAETLSLKLTKATPSPSSPLSLISRQPHLITAQLDTT